jgi:putative hemolysin
MVASDERRERRGPFRLDWDPTSLPGRLAAVPLKPLLRRVLMLREMNHIYEHRVPDDDRDYATRVLEALDIHWSVSNDDLARMPRSGPLIVVANHPFGGIDGMILGSLLRSVRGDRKLLVNFMLGMIPDMREMFFMVDPFGGQGAAQRSVAGIKAALRWVRGGGALGMFPSGEVAHATWRHWRVRECPWQPTIGRIIRQTRAPVTPIFFDGRNSPFFQAMGLIHPKLRTVLLPREMLRRQGTTVQLRIGELIPAETIADLPDDEAVAAYLRRQTCALGGRE